MKAKTEEFLYLLLWAGEVILQPTFRNLTDSFETWAARRGFDRQLQRLEKQQLVEQQNGGADRVIRLSNAGRTQALGGRNPAEEWVRKWDGKWRLAIFDVPQNERRSRDLLRRYLFARGYGCLQNSVWITPHGLTEEKEVMANTAPEVTRLIFFEGNPCAGENAETIVRAAWNFDEINQRYAKYLAVLNSRPTGESKTASLSGFKSWLGAERQAWNEAAQLDPFLPEPLLPAGYQGKKTWAEKLRAMREAAKPLQELQAMRQ